MWGAGVNKPHVFEAGGAESESESIIEFSLCLIRRSRRIRRWRRSLWVVGLSKPTRFFLFDTPLHDGRSLRAGASMVCALGRDLIPLLENFIVFRVELEASFPAQTGCTHCAPRARYNLILLSYIVVLCCHSIISHCNGDQWFPPTHPSQFCLRSLCVRNARDSSS